MNIEDWYVQDELYKNGKVKKAGHASPVLKYERGGENHPNCPTGKFLYAEVTPGLFYQPHFKQAGGVTRHMFENCERPRPLRHNEFFVTAFGKNIELLDLPPCPTDRLARFSGYYELGTILQGPVIFFR